MSFDVTCERRMASSPEALYDAWTHGFELWFAAPGTYVAEAREGSPYFFETHYENERHPHHGRFLRLQPERLVEMTWVTSATLGYETVVTLTLAPDGDGTRLHLRHAGFPNEALRQQHDDAWPRVLAHLEDCLSKPADCGDA
jgi:uncharacterized protein YndB with AHSA1/START domain